MARPSLSAKTMQLYYIGRFGDTRKYTAAELLSDIKHRYVML